MYMYTVSAVPNCEPAKEAAVLRGQYSNGLKQSNI